MKKSTIIIILAILILIILSIFLIINPILTGSAINIPDTYTYTKAICDDSNYCQDNIITCKGNKIISIQPIKGAAVKFDDDWKDPRGEEELT